MALNPELSLLRTDELEETTLTSLIEHSSEDVMSWGKAVGSPCKLWFPRGWVPHSASVRASLVP